VPFAVGTTASPTKRINQVRENESTFIPLGAKHRLENPTDQPPYLIEVQSGAYLGEDDIVRFDDRYNRT
jgi:mannose-6-phosphate isomerase-like protein (cupin superfamily)